MRGGCGHTARARRKPHGFPSRARPQNGRRFLDGPTHRPPAVLPVAGTLEARACILGASGCGYAPESFRVLASLAASPSNAGRREWVLVRNQIRAMSSAMQRSLRQ